MSKNQMLRTLVNERLSAAAEEILALFETTIATYEKELSRFKEENQKKQQLLDLANANKANSPGVLQQRTAGVQIGLDLNQEITKVVIKEEPEEQIVKQEEGEQLPVSVPESSSAICVKREEASPFQHRQTEYRQEAQDVRLESEKLGHTNNSVTDAYRGPPFSCSATHMEVGADGDHFNQLLLKYQSAPETSTTAYQGEESGANEGGESKKHQCSVCKKTFTRKQHLDLHRRVHSGEKPYSCTICNRTFALKGTLEVHMRTHTGERPYSCSICKKTFTQTSALTSHKRTHTGEKPFSCPTCKKTFGQKVHLEVHMRTHTGERPYCCSFCEKPFADSYNLKIHMRVHTGEKPYKCSVCQKGFTVSSNLRAHERTHTAH